MYTYMCVYVFVNVSMSVIVLVRVFVRVSTPKQRNIERWKEGREENILIHQRISQPRPPSRTHFCKDITVNTSPVLQ